MKRLILAVLLLWGPKVGAQTNHSVFPVGLDNVIGNSQNSSVLNFPFEFQQLFSATHLSQLWTSPVQITGIAFRVEDGSSGSYAAVVPRIEIELSTTTRTPGQMSTRWEINRGDNASVVYSHDNVSLRAQGTLPINPFELRLVFDQPFYYDPSAGNLAMRFETTGNSEYFGSRLLDAHSSGALNPNSPYASIEVFGIPGQIRVTGQVLVTEFTWQAVPEPGVAALLALSFPVMVYLYNTKRRKN